MAANMNAVVAKVAGAVLLVVGILGFIPALVIDGALLGIFGVNLLHNLVHLVTGGILLAVGYMNDGANARVTNQIFGVVYLLVAVLGFIAPAFMDTLLNLNGTAAAVSPVWDNVLHLVLGVVFAGVGFGVRASGPVAPRRA